jgi:SAM-dependent methyltransferase
MQDINESVRQVGEPWKDSPYYANAEKQMHVFWQDGTPFRKLFDQLELTATVELACGHGRHASHIAGRCDRLALMDIHAENIDFCRSRLERFSNVEYYVNSGFDFQPLADKSLSAIFCYDAMVHFSPDIVRSYLHDASRVLRPGGMALFHHSNHPAPLHVPYSQNPHARNHMTVPLFASYAAEAGLLVKESTIMAWGSEPDLDGLTLVVR